MIEQPGKKLGTKEHMGNSKSTYRYTQNSVAWKSQSRWNSSCTSQFQPPKISRCFHAFVGPAAGSAPVETSGRSHRPQGSQWWWPHAPPPGYWWGYTSSWWCPRHPFGIPFGIPKAWYPWEGMHSEAIVEKPQFRPCYMWLWKAMVIRHRLRINEFML